MTRFTLLAVESVCYRLFDVCVIVYTSTFAAHSFNSAFVGRSQNLQSRGDKRVSEIFRNAHAYKLSDVVAYCYIFSTVEKRNKFSAVVNDCPYNTLGCAGAPSILQSVVSNISPTHPCSPVQAAAPAYRPLLTNTKDVICSGLVLC